MLKKIEVVNYKSISQVSLPLGAETVIVGQNGVGKSNLLDAIHFLRDAAVDNLDHAITKRHGMPSIRRWSKTRPFNVGIRMHFVSGNDHGDYRVNIASAGGDYSVVEEEGHWFGPLAFLPSGSSGAKDQVSSSFKRLPSGEIIVDTERNPFAEPPAIYVPDADLALSQLGGRSGSILSLFFGRLYAEMTSCGAYSIYPNKIREPQALSNSEVLADDGTNLASIIRQMRSTTNRPSKEQLTSSLRQVLPILDEIQVKSAGGFYVPVFRVTEPENGYSHDLNMAQISDGTLRMLGMLTAFYQPRAPRTITLEEPEQMIHPGLLPVLVDATKDYLDEKAGRQVLLTTHSPNLLDMFSPDSIVAATFADGVSSFAPMADRQLNLIKENLLSAGELMVREGILQ